MKDILGFGIPDVYGGILTQDQLNQLSDQATKRGISMGLLDFITTPKNQGFGTITPYIGKAIGSGLQSYQGGLDAGLAGAIKAKALETDDRAKYGSIDPSKYTPESLKVFEQTGKGSDLRTITKPTDVKVFTPQEIEVLKQTYPKLSDDQEMLTVLSSFDKKDAYKALTDRYAPSADKTDTSTNERNAYAKGQFGGKVNPITGQPYGNNVSFSELAPIHAMETIDKINADKLALAVDTEKAKSDFTVGSKEYQLKTADALRKEYNGQLKESGYMDLEQNYEKIKRAIDSGTPIGDVASATSIMKLLDPGSVVRESELEMAMKTTGLWNRMTNFSERTLKGTKLTPEQRIEFEQLAKEFYEVAKDTKVKIDRRYADIANQYGIPIELLGVRTAGGKGMKTYNPKTGRIE